MDTKIITDGEPTMAAAHHAVVNASAVKGLPELLTPVVIKKDQDGIRTSLIKLDAAIHSNAVQCLLHAEKHGDTSLMRRLLIDIIDAKSGYRRQGVIAWMREFSPMELEGDVISLSGMLNGEKRPFRVLDANATPFTQLASAREMTPLRPVFKDGLTSKVDRATREFKAAVENTLIVAGKDPQPKEVGKPFYNGIHLDKMEDGFAKIEGILAEMNAWNDGTKDVYQSRLALAKAELEVAEAAKH